MVCNDLLQRFTEMSRQILGSRLTGVYLHGSAAMGCFNPAKSDLDLLLVVDDEIPDSVKMEFMNEVVKFNREAPPKGIELSIVKREYCKPFVYPTPFVLHFSPAHLSWFHENPEDYIAKMKGTDKDLAAHFTIMNHYGAVLYGASVQEVFGEVPAHDYIDSIWCDIENTREDILTDPIYVTLNLCRVLAYLQEGLVLSKQAGGEWGLHTLPQKFHSLLNDALRCYLGGEELLVSPEIAADFANDMMVKIEKYVSNSQ